MRMEPLRIILFAMSTDSSVLLKLKFGDSIKKWIFHLIEWGWSNVMERLYGIELRSSVVFE
jgi:hypothetical protein